MRRLVQGQERLMAVAHHVASVKGADRAEFLSTFFWRLRQRGLRLCILHGFEGLPHHVPSDIDCLVPSREWEAVLQELYRHCRDTGWRIANAIQYEATSWYFCLAGCGDGEWPTVCLDISTDYRKSALFYSEELIWKHAQRLGDFYVPTPSFQFGYYLIKKVLKRSLNSDHADKLVRLFKQDRDGGRREIARFFSPETASRLTNALETKDWDAVRRDLPSLRRELLQRAWFADPYSGLIYGWRETCRRLSRWWLATGLWVAFLGPDGVGKSTVIAEAEKRLAPLFRKTKRGHFRPGLFGKPRHASVATDPHGRPPYGALFSLLKLGHLADDYLLGYPIRVRPHLVRSGLLLYDRCYHDILVDPRRYRYGGPLALARAAGGMLPRPDVFVFLDAPEDVLLSRKRELPREELRRQRKAYAALAERLKPSVVVDASRPLDEVAKAACEAVVAALERRTLARLGLGGEA